MEQDYKVVRANSRAELKHILSKLSVNGWSPVGELEVFDNEYAQAIRMSIDIDDTEEITQEITQLNVRE